jgi:pantoate--beta-alanine ligase
VSILRAVRPDGETGTADPGGRATTIAAMDVLEGLRELRARRAAAAGRLGLVPTMGALHPGHRALLRAARDRCDTVAASLFVNPTQFGAEDDFAGYPRTWDRDLEILATEGVDFVWAPPAEVMYPEGPAATVDPGRLATVLEGKARPGHFAGVATVVARLFEQVHPDIAFFGQKDWQQTRVIADLVERLEPGIELAVVATVREADGLAWSSRNVRLDGEGRRAATVLYRGLAQAAAMFAEGTEDAEALREIVRTTVASESLARLEYATVADALDLTELEIAREPVVFSGAVTVGGVHLIDNIVVGLEFAREDGTDGAGAGL